MEVLISLASVVVALAAVYIAGAQFVLATKKTKTDLFDRRYALFRLLWGYMSAHVINRDSLADFTARLNNDQHQFLFLFDQSIFDYVQDVYLRGIRFSVADQVAQRNMGPPEGIQKAHHELADLTMWFANEVPGLAQRFSPYLRLEEWNGVPAFVQHRLKGVPDLLLPSPIKKS